MSTWRGLEHMPIMKAVDSVISGYVTLEAMPAGVSLGDANLVERLALDAGFSVVDVQQVDLRLTIKEPVPFAQMMMWGSAIFLPEVQAVPEKEREEMIVNMQSDLETAFAPFMQDGVMTAETSANLLIAST